MEEEQFCNLCKKAIDARVVPDHFKGRVCADCWQQIEQEVAAKQLRDEQD